MRNGLERNKREFWYAEFIRDEPVYDEYGNETGTQPVYGNPVQAFANISAAKGAAEQELFGVSEAYDRVINPLPKGFPLNAVMRLWVDVLPTIDGNGGTETPHDYVPTLPASGLNHSLMGIKRVSVS